MLGDMPHIYFQVMWNQNCIYKFKRLPFETLTIMSSFLMLPSPCLGTAAALAGISTKDGKSTTCASC